MGAFSYVEEFLHHERAAGKAAATLRNRRAALDALSRWLDEQGKSEQEATPADLVGFLNSLVGRYTPEHVNQAVSALRVYCRWLAEEGIRSDGANPAARLEFLRAPLKPLESLTEADRFASSCAGLPRALHGSGSGYTARARLPCSCSTPAFEWARRCA